MGILSGLYYILLKTLASIVRAIVVTEIWFRRTVLKTTVDWERSFPEVSRVYTIDSSEGRSIIVRVLNIQFFFGIFTPVHCDRFVFGSPQRALRVYDLSISICMVSSTHPPSCGDT